MPTSKQLPSGDAFQKEWQRLDKDARRRVRQAANRAQPAANKREAALAAAMAINQQRLWRIAWVAGPLLVAAMQFGSGWGVVIANFSLAVAVFGLMAMYFTRKARKAELINREVMAGRRPNTGPAKGRRRGKGSAKDSGKGSAKDDGAKDT